MSETVPPQDLEYLNKTYRVSRRIVRLIGGNIFGMRVHGLDHISAEYGSLLAANHRGELEILGFPAVISDRHVTELSKYELLEAPILGAYFRKLGSIPVHRGGPTKEEFATMVAIPKAGRIEATFPEGTRNKARKKAREHADLDKLMPGTARIARLAGVVTHPTALYGFDRLVSYYRVVAFGEGMEPPSHRSEEEEWTYRLKRNIEDLYVAAHHHLLPTDKIKW